MKIRWTWKEAFRFALARHFLTKENLGLSYDMGRLEKFGSFSLRPLDQIIHWISYHIRKPWIIPLFTLFVALSVAFVFYNIPAFVVLGKIFPSKLVRFLFFFYIETNLFGLGCRAVGRFNNSSLIALWKKDQLIPIFPGDTKTYS